MLEHVRKMLAGKHDKKLDSFKVRNSPWIGVDLDGTVAKYDKWRGPCHIGEPILPMVKRIQTWLNDGRRVKIFTARVTESLNSDGSVNDIEQVKFHIEEWCKTHIGQTLEITNVKDFGMVELWDDRAVRVLVNQGDPCCDYHGDH